MAGPDDLETRLIATDDASAVIDRVAEKAEALEKLDPTIDIGADGAKAETAVKSLAERVENLTDKQKDIILKATVAQAEEDIKRLERGLRGFREMSEDEVQIRLVALDKATDDLEAARQLRDQLSAKPAEVEIHADDRASGDLERVGDKARDLDGQKVDIDVQASGLDTVLGKLGELEGGFGRAAGALGTLSAGGGVATAAGAVAVALGAAAISAADIAISAQSLATLTGDTVEDASRLQEVWKLSGADVQDLADVALQVQGALAQSPELAEQLGIDLDDGATGGQRLAQALEKVRNFTGSAAEKAQLMSSLFGEEGARQAATLLAIVEDIPKALDDVNPDKIISDDDVDQARQFKGEVAQLTSEFQAVALEIGQNVIPAASDLLGILGDIAGIEIGGQGIFDIGGYNAIKSLFENDDIEVKFAEPDLKPLVRGFQDAASSGEELDRVAGGIASAMGDMADEIEEAKDATDALHDTQRRATDSQYAHRAALDDLAEVLVGYSEKVKGAEGNTIELNRINEEVRQSTVDVADAQVQAAKDMAARMGITLESKDAERIWRDSMVDSTAFMNGPQRQAILDYIANVEGIKPEKVTAIEAAIAAGDLEEAKRLLNEAANGPYDATVNVFVDPALANAKTTLDAIDGMTARATVQITSVLNGLQGTPRATGGTTGIGETTILNDGNGIEAVRLPSGSLVYTAERTSQLGGGSSTMVINNYPPGIGLREFSRAQRSARRRGFGRTS